MNQRELRSFAAKITAGIPITDHLKQRQKAAWTAILESGGTTDYSTEPWDHAAIASTTRLDAEVVEALQVLYIAYCCQEGAFCKPTAEHYGTLCVDYIDAVCSEAPPISMQHWPVHRCCCTYEDPAAEENG